MWMCIPSAFLFCFAIRSGKKLHIYLHGHPLPQDLYLFAEIWAAFRNPPAQCSTPRSQFPWMIATLLGIMVRSWSRCSDGWSGVALYTKNGLPPSHIIPLNIWESAKWLDLNWLCSYKNICSFNDSLVRTFDFIPSPAYVTILPTRSRLYQILNDQLPTWQCSWHHGPR